MIYVTGDTHGHIDVDKLSYKNWPESRDLKHNDYLIVLGDFGFVWEQEAGSHKELYWYKWLKEKPYTTLFVDGNHENFDRLKRLSTKSMFGSKVGIVDDGIYHLRRGHVYTIDGKTIFTLGGAKSFDKVYRTEGRSWWPEEMITEEDELLAYSNLDKVGWKVDYVLTHTAPTRVIEQYRAENPTKIVMKMHDVNEYKLDMIRKRIKCKRWYAGHWHINWRWNKYQILYEKIMKLF